MIVLLKSFIVDQITDSESDKNHILWGSQEALE